MLTSSRWENSGTAHSKHEREVMDSTQKNARVAGFLYLLVVLTAPIGLIYVPGKLIVQGDAAGTASRILAGQSLFRIGIVSGLASSVIFIFLGLALYRLLRDVNQHRALLMLVLALAQVPISFLNEVNGLAALMLLRGGGYLAVFQESQRQALAMLFLNVRGQGIIVTEIFWGLWLIPFGLLVFRSGFLPRFLGVWLNLNGVAYLAVSFAGLLVPGSQQLVSKIVFPALLGEMVVMLWLLIRGARPKALAEADLAARSS